MSYCIISMLWKYVFVADVIQVKQVNIGEDAVDDPTFSSSELHQLTDIDRLSSEVTMVSVAVFMHSNHLYFCVISVNLFILPGVNRVQESFPLHSVPSAISPWPPSGHLPDPHPYATPQVHHFVRIPQLDIRPRHGLRRNGILHDPCGATLWLAATGVQTEQ